MNRPCRFGITLALILSACSSPEPSREQPKSEPEETVPEERKTPSDPPPLNVRKSDLRILKTLDFRDRIPDCHLHDDGMQEDIVLIVGGLPDTRWEEPNTFPQANTELWIGSCVAGPELLARVRYCPTCRERKAAYLDGLANRER